MTTEQISRELIRALRGRRSQRAFSRWLGYSTNVVYTWEAGRRWPTAAEALRVAERARVDVREALRRFFNTAPPWLDSLDPATPEGVVALLRTLRGDTRISEIARRAGADRHAVGRWLSGRTEPKLPQFLALVEAASLRALDFLAVLVDPEQLPSVAEPWRVLVGRRQVAQELPWAPALLRALELVSYKELPAHRPGWLAATVGIDLAEEARCLAALEASGEARWDGLRYVPVEVAAVDTRLAPGAGRRMRQHWSQVASRQIDAGAPGQFSYNVFAISRADLERLREMHLAYFRALRALVADSGPSEVLAVANVQLFTLEGATPAEPSAGSEAPGPHRPRGSARDLPV